MPFTPFRSKIIFSFSRRAIIREDSKLAADGGLWHQEEILSRLARWRADPLGLALAIALFGPDAPKARSLAPLRLSDLSAKPDFGARLLPLSGAPRDALVSAKLIAGAMTSSDARASHHASRAKFSEAHLHGILPESDLLARAALLEHFIDGEPLARQSPERLEAGLSHLRAHWGAIARAALEGLSNPKPSFLLISRAEREGDSWRLLETRLLPMGRAVELASEGIPSASEPREGQVGTLGTRMLHLQRGQSLASGPQRDIQTKVNAAALFEAAGPLPALPSRASL